MKPQYCENSPPDPPESIAMQSKEIRQLYRDFFVARGHEAWPSDTLVPQNDPTLLFSSAGMVQFKPYFRGEMGDALKRATTCQKCFRTSDIENVGYTHRHHTFFEMLGNFSFGDYFKQDAVQWAWEFSVDVVKLDPDRIWITVFEEDDESAEMWQTEVGVSPQRIVRMGAEDNFWPAAGILGPSGPCSELYYDMGEAHGPAGGPAEDNDRYLEYWNLVFTQFDRQADGSLPPLARKNIDTGLGLDRLAAILQGHFTNFENDLLRPVIDHVEERTGTKFGSEEKNDCALRVIADHARATVMVLTDNVTPSNAGRGYVLRRIMRRAVRYGLVLGIEDDLLAPAMEVAAAVMREEYPDVAERLDYTQRIARAEEETFRSTLLRGLTLLSGTIERVKESGRTRLSGKEVFALYDTYGFPPDLTQEILAESNLGYDRGEFDEAMEEQRTRSRESWRGGDTVWEVDDANLPATRFVGYDRLETETKVVAVYAKGKPVDEAAKGERVEIVIEETPFYGESGGQVGDQGRLVTTDAAEIEVIDTTRSNGGVFFHQGEVVSGRVRAGDTIRAEVRDSSRRLTKGHHTATHLMQAALQKVVGDHVKQSGSRVEPNYLRFDFTHYEAVTSEQLEEIERLVNAWIWENHSVSCSEVPIAEAKARGAMALFGEKYGDVVRMVEVAADGGDTPLSLELCGGTHVETTGAVGTFKIASESAISAGNRRIEAVCGPAAVRLMQRREQIVKSVTGQLRVSLDELPPRVERLLEQQKQTERELKEARQQVVSGTGAAGGLGEPETLEGRQLLLAFLPGMRADDLQSAMDQAIGKLSSGIAVLGSEVEGKLNLVCATTEDLTKSLPAGKIAKTLAQIAGGGGGGKPTRATAGGKNPDAWPEIETKARAMVEQGKV